MVIHDIYLLQRSDDFYLPPCQEASVDLALKKVPLNPHTILSGLVVGGCGPLAEATVKVFSMDYKPIAHSVTDKDGKFHFKNVLHPGSYRVLATAAGFNLSTDNIVSLTWEKPENMIIRVTPSELVHQAVVYGTIWDSLGFALCDADIHIYSHHCPGKIVAWSQSNNDGEYMVYGLKPGKYRITALKAGYFLQAPATFTCFPNEIVPLDLFLYEDCCMRNGTVSGRIRAGNKPVPFATVALYHVKDDRHILIAVKEANGVGVYLFDHVQPGRYLVKAKLEDKSEICSKKFILR